MEGGPLTCRPAPMCVSHLMGPVDLARNCASLALKTGSSLIHLPVFFDYRPDAFLGHRVHILRFAFAPYATTRPPLRIRSPAPRPRERLVDIIDSCPRFSHTPPAPVRYRDSGGNARGGCPLARAGSNTGSVTASSWVPSLSCEYKPPLSSSRMEHSDDTLQTRSLLLGSPRLAGLNHVLRPRSGCPTPHPPATACPRCPRRTRRL